MDSDPCESQPTQLLQHALAPAQQNEEERNGCDQAPPKDGGDSLNDFSWDSRVIPARSMTPRYHLQAQSLLPSPSDSGGRVLVEDSQNESRQKNRELPRTPFDEDGSGSELFPLGGDRPVSASVAKVIATRVDSRPTMPLGSRHYCRSPSLPSQDSFAGPISQDPAQQYLASAKQFDVPLSDLGETPTQQVIHSPTDPGMTLPDATEHKEFLEAAMREYDAQRANRHTSNHRPNIPAVASSSKSGESSGTSQHKHDDLSFHSGSPEFDGQESRFQFNGSSSFDKMLDRDLTDGPDPTPEPAQVKEIEPSQVNDLAESAKDNLNTSLQSNEQCSPAPPFEWVVPTPSSAVASSNPRSLLRMVHPDNLYRIAKMKNLAGKVEPRPCVATCAEAQPSSLEETQPCHTDRPIHLDDLPLTQSKLGQTRTATARLVRHQTQTVGEDEEPEDALDVVPDSEPLRAGSSTQSPTHHRVVTQKLKKTFYPLSPTSECGLADTVPGSLEIEESEADIPLAIEIASRKTKTCVALTEGAPLHDRKMKIASVVHEKASTFVHERQSQNPASHSMIGKSSRVNPSKTEPTEVPTSLPEQDLQSPTFFPRQRHTTTTNKIPSKNKMRGTGVSEARAHTNTMICLAATKSVGGNKRFRMSDAESSEDTTFQPTEDERPVDGIVRKEEEEETGSTDDHDADLLPLPPPKPNISRKKRRRIEDANPPRGLSKASASNRNKPSGTPAITTRSAKRLRSVVSSVRGLAVEPATRVFALWKQDGHYYSGVVYSRGSKSKYLVRFDDGTEDEVELKNIRHRELMIGDRVIVIQDNFKGAVSDVSRTNSHGSFVLETNNGIQTLGFHEIRVANRTIQSQWKGRTVREEDVVTVVRPKPLIDTTPSKQSVASMTSGRAQRELVKTGFVVTINPKNGEPMQTKDKTMRAIQEHGGLVIEDWSSVFTMEGKHSQSNKRWFATPQDFRWKSEVKLDRVFLLSDDAHQKPKFLLALALGIPCLSFEWLTRGGKFSSDWQPFLLSAGYSDTLGARVSQLVDLDWGNCAEHLTDIMESAVPIKLFSQKSVLCIGAELVPLSPNRGRKNNVDEASRYVPWIILCMGAARVEAVADTKQVTPAHMQTFDYIVVKERGVLGSLELGKVVVGDVNWVKECLVSSRLSIPKFD